MPDVSHDTIRNPSGSYSYRLHDGSKVLLTSGPFLLEKDADALGQHFASDPDILAFIKD